MRRPDDLPRELGLQLRMLLALALSGTLLVAVVGALAYLTFFVTKGWSVAAMVAMIAGTGALRAAEKRQHGRRSGVPEKARHRLQRVAQRLAVVADMPPPRTEVRRSRLPLSWTFASLTGPPTVHATTGLLQRLDDRELQAVVAHELGHLLHRDAIVVTLLAGPPAAFFAGLRQMIDDDPVRGVIGAAVFVPLFAPPALALWLLSRIVCRHRELAADRAAAVLTGSPAAVAAALVAVDADLSRQRKRDLRRAAARDAFHFVPARSPRFAGRLWATHPSLSRRMERLQRLEAGLQGR